MRVETQKIAHFAAGRNQNPPPFTTPVLSMARRQENRRSVDAIFTPRPVLSGAAGVCHH
jgi:hypothetical protein